jgi:hypothetical protein
MSRMGPTVLVVLCVTAVTVWALAVRSHDGWAYQLLNSDEIDAVEATHRELDEFLERHGRCPRESDILSPDHGNMYLSCDSRGHQVGVGIGFDDAIWVEHRGGQVCWSWARTDCSPTTK